MNFVRSLHLSIPLMIIMVLPAHADSSVWRIIKGDNELFIGGTIHILSDRDYPLPSEFDEAYSQSAKLVFETDTQKLKSPDYQQIMLRSITYQDGRNLKQLLSIETYQALEKHCLSRGIPITNILNFKPGMAATILTMVELQSLGLFGTGVDEFYTLKAITDQKEIGQLESVDEQIAFIASMGVGQEDELIAYTLHDIARLSQLWQSMNDAWRIGDLDQLKKIALAPLLDVFPDLYDELLVQRNDAWIPKIEAMLKTEDVEFVLFGALHLV